MRRWVLAVGSGLLVLVLVALGLSRSNTSPETRVAIQNAVTADTTGYTRAIKPRPFVFPEDHGAHPDFKLEWWYLTGNLATADGRRFGYQFTIFRNALAPPPETSAVDTTDWTTRQLYFAHLAVTDVASGEFYAFERFSRGASGLAGAQAEPFHVWIEGWSITQDGADFMPLRVTATEGDVAIDFLLTQTKPTVLQGEAGLSQKGEGVGNASYYYSMTRLATEGTIRIGDQTYDIDGQSWMDREWSTSMLSGTQEGWDWFSVQLDDGRDLMYFQLRESDPNVIPYTHSVLIAPDGSKQDLGPVTLTVIDTWTSPESGIAYPSGWTLDAPDQNLALTITPLIPNQELDVVVQYWEGAVRIGGTSAGQPIGGYGYVEMTGYGGTPMFGI
ncbi:MAG: lipocalin-like domain-containing protein [Rhodothermales bacterium]